MITIHKQVLRYPNILVVPAGAIFRSVQIQNDEITVWYECNTEQPMEQRHLRIYGTGHEMDVMLRQYIGTMQAGPYVWHVYEVFP